MHRFAISLLCVIALPSVVHGDAAALHFQQRVLPVLQAHCVECHGGEKPAAGLNLTGQRTADQLLIQEALWFQVLERVESGSMPPKDAPPLAPADKRLLTGWIDGDYRNLLLAQQRKEGRSKVRRLTRNEYANTIQDLLGVRPPVTRELPVDGRVDGFDKVSGALPLSSAHAAGFVKLAEDLLRGRLAPPPKMQERSYRLWAGPSEQSQGHILELADGTMVSFNTDTTSGPLRRKSPEGKLIGAGGARIPGVHKLRISVYAYQTDKPLAFGIYAGHTGAYPQLLTLLKVLEAPPGKPAVLETEVYFRTRLDNDLAPISDGFRLVPFGLGVQVPKNTLASNCKGPGLAVQWVDVEEPELPLTADRWLTADLSPEMLDLFTRAGVTLKNAKRPREEILTAAEKTFARIGGDLFRRDLTPAELAAITTRFGESLDSGAPLKTALLDETLALLTAPDFLCRFEQPGPLNGFALAARLSYFLWNSTPDAELLALARSGRLTDSQILREQTERLLADPKSQRFVNDFLDQWLGLWGIDNTTPDKDLYPEYDDLLKISSLLETQATFRRMLDKNLSVRDFVAPEWALVNERLAVHYGIPGVTGFALQEVRFPAETPFGGIWTHASTMKVTANGTLTSPVKRGVWVAERLLGVKIPPPPANIEPVDPDTRGAKTLREQLELHRQGSCSACHARFDPYGFALESFDVTGAFRTNYRIVSAAPRPGMKKWDQGLPVDCSGVTPDGKPFASVRELRQMLAKDPAQLARGVTRHLLTYATGEPASPLDQPTIDAIVASAAKDAYGLRTLIHGVVQSEVFRSK